MRLLSRLLYGVVPCAALVFGLHAAAQAALPKLPETGTVYVVEGTAEPVQIHGTELKFNPHAAANIARSFVYVGSQRTMEAPGTAADVSLTETKPVFYVRLNAEDPEVARKRLELVYLTVNEKTRTVATFTANVFGGHIKRHEDVVPVTKTSTTSPVWLEVTPKEALEPGQYALAFMPATQVDAPEVIYAFSVPDSSNKTASVAK